MYSCGNDIQFTHIFENTFSKWISITFSILVTLISTPIIYLVIKYEEDNQFRILMNQLISSICMLAILFNCTVRLLIILLYIIGPLPEFVCVLIVTLHGGFTIQLILLLNCIIVVRYLFTFYIKNPPATQHDFWMLFLSIWSLGFGIVSQSAYIFCLEKILLIIMFALGRSPSV